MKKQIEFEQLEKLGNNSHDIKVLTKIQDYILNDLCEQSVKAEQSNDKEEFAFLGYEFSVLAEQIIYLNHLILDKAIENDSNVQKYLKSDSESN